MSNILVVTKLLPGGRVAEAIPLDGGSGYIGVFLAAEPHVFTDCFAYGSWLDCLCALRMWEGAGIPAGFAEHTQPKEES